MSVSTTVRKIIDTPNAPQDVGPDSQAVQVDKTLYISGQIGIDPSTSKFAGPDIRTQTTQALKNMDAILTAAEMNFGNVVKATLFLSDIDDFTEANKIYAEYFKKPFPARSAIEAGALPAGARVEIEAIAVAGPFA